MEKIVFQKIVFQKIKRLEKELAELKKLPKIKLQVHERFKYVAVSRLGRIVLSENKLKKIDVYWGGETLMIVEHLPQKTIDYLKSFTWSESLHEIEHIE